MTKEKIPSLVLCLVMDVIGYATYLLPGIGEFADIVWAPVSGLIFYSMFGGWRGAAGSIFNFVEEILPGTDFIPSFTLMWCWQHFRKKRDNRAAFRSPANGHFFPD